jgi:hypothetical protein
MQGGDSQGPGALPNLFVIGALKAGTTSLHSYLDAHPEIGMSQVKELDYFIDQYNWGRGLDWYRSNFDPAFGVRGESSPMYTMRPGSERAARRIHRLAPDARLIYVVRDPIERTVSHYLHAQAAGIEHRPLEEALADFDSDYLGTSMYAYQLEPFLELFGPERILVVSQEEMLRDRRAMLRRVFAFLAVDASFDTPDFDREWMVTAGRGRAFQAVRATAERLGVRGAWARLPPRTRWWITRALSSRSTETVAKPEPSPELRRRLVEAFADDAAALRRLTGDAYADWQV